MDTHTDMAVFARVVERRSFTAAGKELRMSTSTVSKHIARLEQSLSLKLLERHAQGPRPTEAGDIFYAHCVQILSAMATARAETMGVSDEIKGVLRIHSMPGIALNFVAPASTEFAKAYPSVELDLSIGALPSDLADRGLDVVVASGHLGQDDPKNYDTFLLKILGEVPYIVAASPTYFQLRGAPAHPSDLVSHNCLIHMNGNRAPTQWLFIKDKKPLLIGVKGSFRSTSADAVAMAAVQGLGIAFLPEYAIRPELKNGSLVSVFKGEVQARRVIKIFYGRNRYVPQKTRTFVDFLKKKYRVFLGEDDVAPMVGNS